MTYSDITKLYGSKFFIHPIRDYFYVTIEMVFKTKNKGRY